MTWTPDLISRAMYLRTRGFSHSQIGLQLGVTRNMVAGKLWRLDNRKSRGLGYGRPIGCAAKTSCDTWDMKTFEPYAAFKARKRMERMRDHNAQA